MGHHFLPKNLYLKPFIFSKDRPFIWVHEFQKEPAHRHWDYVASINELHTIRRSTGEKDDSLEKHLKKYEDALAPIVERVISDVGDGTLDIEGRRKFALFVGMMYVKTPRFFAKNRELADRIRHAADSALLGNKEPFIEIVNETKTDANQFFQSANFESIADWIKNPEVYDHFHLILIEGQAHRFAKALFEEMRWNFLVPPEGVELITSDNPVSVCQITPSNLRDFYAIGRNDSEVYFPISTNLCFQAYHDPHQKPSRRKGGLILSMTKHEVENINQRTVAFAQKYAYSRSKIDIQQFFKLGETITE